MTTAVDVWAIRSPRAADAVHRALPGILRMYLDAGANDHPQARA